MILWYFVKNKLICELKKIKINNERFKKLREKRNKYGPVIAIMGGVLWNSEPKRIQAHLTLHDPVLLLT